VGLLFTNRMWTGPEFGEAMARTECDPKPRSGNGDTEILDEVSRTHRMIQTLDKTIVLLEAELAAAKAGVVHIHIVPR
jgi:hypothetical protein